MEKLSQSYSSIPRASAAEFLHPHQLRLYGVVYNPDVDEHQYTIGGLVCENELSTIDTAQSGSSASEAEEAYEPPFNIFLGV